MWKLMVAVLGVSLVAAVALSTVALSGEREGYYYPAISSEEVFGRTMLDVPPPGRDARVRFIVNVTKAQLAAPENPRFVVFEKGGDAEHMIIVALDDQVFSTLYRARAVLAQLTASVRGGEFFDQSGLVTEATWFDMAKLLGFEDVVVSDGKNWAHRVVLR